MWINTESDTFTPEQIAKIEKVRNARYVFETSIKDKHGIWSNIPVAVFYDLNPTEYESSYFGVYLEGAGNIYVTSAQSIEDEPITGVVADSGEIVYSRHRHDFRRSQDGSVFIDGGRDYVRSGMYPREMFVEMKVQDGYLTVVSGGTK